MLGFILIIIGATFLLKNLGIISQGAWEIIGPTILIFFGIWIAAKKRTHLICSECFGFKKRHEKNHEKNNED